MSIILEHIPYFREVFGIPGLLTNDTLLIGLPDIEGKYKAKDFSFGNLKEYLINKGLKNILVLDLFDKRADINIDLNLPIHRKYYEKFNLVIDIGTIEHVFNTAQCLENYIRMVKVNGSVLIITCVNGYFGHGLHVFNPQLFIDTFKRNKLDIKYLKFITSTGIEVNKPKINKDVLIWIVASKTRNLNKFIYPQQVYWKNTYKRGVEYMKKWKNKATIIDIFYIKLFMLKRFLINSLPIRLKNLIYH